MRIVIVAESFLPQTNGVVHSVLRVLDHLASRGDEVLVVVPDAATEVPHEVAGARVVTLPAWAFPGYPDVRVATGRVSPVTAILRDFDPDVVHLASPFALGWRAALAANALDIPVVAVYQTDVPTYAGRYGIRGVENLLWKRVRDVHGRADLNLVPSTATLDTLQAQGVERLVLWRRGVDTERFSPARRDDAWPSRRTASGSSGTSADSRRRSRCRTSRPSPACPAPASSSWATDRSGGGSSGCCPVPTSPGCCTAPSSRPRWRASTSW